MFTVKAGYSNDIEIRSSAERVREFFLDIRNFADLMPGVMQVHTDAKGIAHWRVQTEIPMVGQILQKFPKATPVAFCPEARETLLLMLAVSIHPAGSTSRT